MKNLSPVRCLPRLIGHQHDHRENVVGDDHQAKQNPACGKAEVPIEIGGKRQADDAAVTPKGALHVNATIFPNHTPAGPEPGDGETRQGRAQVEDQKAWIERGIQISPDDAQKYQGRQGSLEHQCRGGIYKGIVDPANPAKSQANKDHGKHGQCGFHGLQEQIDQGHQGWPLGPGE